MATFNVGGRQIERAALARESVSMAREMAQHTRLLDSPLPPDTSAKWLEIHDMIIIHYEHRKQLMGPVNARIELYRYDTSNGTTMRHVTHCEVQER